ncbi:hypothetical protein M758_8G132700 [Ceratodon purpureus]|uniref:Uncharacterized protein n=1 Tax=Ceratodon purpureus TaxID=3225 RepID=A0A8T0H6P1_CERPU|nr:hypothetical protein KC19_8G137800 [Ceratodon purpureus]KAG0608791.1 hypothetical protein M758_8G132700 [Ceratodon purpureus]
MNQVSFPSKRLLCTCKSCRSLWFLLLLPLSATGISLSPSLKDTRTPKPLHTCSCRDDELRSCGCCLWKDD